MKQSEIKKYQEVVNSYFNKANIVITEEERQSIEIADLGLGEYEITGLGILTYVNTDRCCAKELVLLPNQTCPEHRHPNVDGKLGKEETFRCRYGEVYLYVSGDATKEIKAILPKNGVFTVFKEIILKQGEQYTLAPNTLHWFQSGNLGAIISEFSTQSTDELDIFTDKRISRIPTIEA